MARLIRFQHQARTLYGRLSGDTIHVLTGSLFDRREESGETLSLSDVHLLAPCQPTKVLCVGFNYRDHAEEFNTPLPERPNIFMKPLTTLTGPEAPVFFPKTMAKQVDYEAELVAVIGRRARHVRPEEALDHVLGYTIGNDVTARDMQDPTQQWTVYIISLSSCSLRGAAMLRLGIGRK